RTIGLPGKIEGNSVVMERVTHTVKRGETLRSIAAKYGVTVTELRQWNHITTPAVRIGTRLRIREQDEATASQTSGRAKSDAATGVRLVSTNPAVDVPVLDTPAGKPDTSPDKVSSGRTHTVRAGETINDIARRHNVSVDALKKLNNLRGGHLTPGQKLLL